MLLKEILKLTLFTFWNFWTRGECIWECSLSLNTRTETPEKIFSKHWMWAMKYNTKEVFKVSLNSNNHFLFVSDSVFNFTWRLSLCKHQYNKLWHWSCYTDHSNQHQLSGDVIGIVTLYLSICYINFNEWLSTSTRIHIPHNRSTAISKCRNYNPVVWYLFDQLPVIM